jgi:fructan beta-fructosidase
MFTLAHERLSRRATATLAAVATALAAAILTIPATPAQAGSVADYPEYPYPATAYDEPLRGQFHFSPQAGWMNDINAPLYYRGAYHLFFQHNPHGLSWDTMHWGHATSTDLVHWKQQPIALEPGVHNATLFSGSGWVDTANVTGLKKGDDDPIILYTNTDGVSIAYSTDGAKTFQMYKDGAKVITTAPGSRDPKVFWDAARNRWGLTIFSDEGGRHAKFYSSTDLLSWTHRGDYRSDWFYECPDLYQLPVDGDKGNVKWVLQDASGNYVLGQLNSNGVFAPDPGWTAPQRMDAGNAGFGGTVYGGQTFNQLPGGRVVQMFWQPGNRGSVWTGNASFPSELALKTLPAGVRITRNPVSEIAGIREPVQNFGPATITTDPASNPLKGVSADTYEIEATFDVTGATATDFGFELHRRADGSRDAAIGYDWARRTLAGFHMEPVGNKVKLRVLVDRGQLEAFGNDGVVSFTHNENFNSAPTSQGIRVYANNGTVKLESLKLYTINSTWKTTTTPPPTDPPVTDPPPTPSPTNPIENPSFETGDLSGWTTAGSAFSKGDVTETDTYWGGTIGKTGKFHMWGFNDGGDGGTGTLTSSTFVPASSGRLSFRIGGGGSAQTYVALIDVATGAELLKASGADSEAYRTVTWDTKPFLGKRLAIQAVDKSTAGFGHINLDDVIVEGTADGGGGGGTEDPATIVNPSFETGTLQGWTATGDAFQGGVTSDTSFGWGCCFGQAGSFHLWGFKAKGDAATGTLTSSPFKLAGSGKISFLVSGGNSAADLYVALLPAAGGAPLRTATGADSEQYRRVTWDAADLVGKSLVIQVVDKKTGGWGHINLDDVTTTSDPTEPPPPGPGDEGALAKWSFNETSGTTARDSVSGSSDAVTYVFNSAVFKPSSPPLWQSAPATHERLAKSLEFDGFSTWVTKPDAAFATPTGAMTVEAWVAPRAFEWGDEGKLSAIVDKHDEGARQGFFLGVGRHGRWSFQVGVNGAWHSATSSLEGALDRMRWQHIAGVFDPGAGQVRLYRNGVLVGQTDAPRGSSITPWTGPLVLGKHNQAVRLNDTFSLNMFSGLMDEVTIRRGALSAATASSEHQAAVAALGGSIPLPDLSANRSRYAGDKYRPQFHATAPEHWMNEPHAPVYANGKYHLFYQHNQHGPYWHNMSWGHWTSPDMVSWSDQPVALTPTANSVAPDGVWSGSAFKDADGTPLLFFTAGDDSIKPNQRTGVARPKDPTDPDLKDWVMDPQVVTSWRADLDVGAGRKVQPGEFRDPFVWREGNTWFQLVTSGVATDGGSTVGGTVLLYTSPNAKDWTYSGPLMVGDKNAYPKTGDVWELPVFLPVGTDAAGKRKHALIINPMWRPGSDDGGNNVKHVWYWIGTWDAAGRKFTPDTTVPREFDYGQHWTGPSGLVDEKGRAVLFSITQDQRTERAHHDAGWAHNAGLPTVLSLQPDGDLGVAPLSEMSALHESVAPLVEIQQPTTVAAANTALAGVHGDMLHVKVTLTSSAGKFGLDVRKSPGEEERTRISYLTGGGGRIEVDRTRSGNVSSRQDMGIQGGPLAANGKPITIEAFVDKSQLDAFVNGAKSLTTRMYPARSDSDGLAIHADGAATVTSLQVWKMKPAFG